MGNTGLQYILVTVLQAALQIVQSDCYKLESRHKRQEDTTTEVSTISSSTISTEITTTSNTTVVEYQMEANKVGLVVGVICGVLAAIVAMAIVVTIWIRNKRSRDSEYARAAKVQRNSTLNAGVYNDLTTAAPIVKKPTDHQKESSEMDKLKMEDEEV